MIVTGQIIDYKKQCKTAFGAYVQALHETNPTNTMALRTIGCIYLRYIEDHATGYKLLNRNPIWLKGLPICIWGLVTSTASKMI